MMEVPEGALCVKVGDPEDWFPGCGEWGTRGLEAVAVCTQCPVRQECLDIAMREETTARGEPVDRRFRFGVRGGLSPTERMRLAKPVECGPTTEETCRQGHPRTPENTDIDNRGWRSCAECRRERVRRNNRAARRARREARAA